MMPEYGLGFWQCKLRYQSQEELLTVAREYKKRKIPLDVIVADFFHWVHQGEWSFDPKYWPDPKAMVDELKSMDVELMVSIWPTVETKSKYYDEMIERGLLEETRGDLMHTPSVSRATMSAFVRHVWYCTGVFTSLVQSR